jgi:hypothetical protein
MMEEIVCLKMKGPPIVLAVLASSNLRSGKQKIAMFHHVCELAFFFLPGCMKLCMHEALQVLVVRQLLMLESLGLAILITTCFIYCF